MSKTVHVLPIARQWAVQRGGRRTDGIFPTQRKAIEIARGIVRQVGSGQLVVHRRNGGIRLHRTYGMPKIQQPRGGSSRRIAKAVEKVIVEGLYADLQRTSGKAVQ